jgi:hypothetical protein
MCRSAVLEKARLRASNWKATSILPIAMGLLFFVMECSRYLYLFRFDDNSKLAQWVPDDAFYYLVLGRNFALLHKWTFDGVASATGFHLVWGYTIALIYWLIPSISLHQIFTFLYFTVALLMAVSLSLVCAMTRRLFGPLSVLGPVAIFCTFIAVQLPNFLMESGLVVFSSCLAVCTVFREEKPLTSSALAAAFGVGLLGMLSRSDFGLLPLLIFVVCVAIYRSIQAPQARIARYVLTGSIVGLLLVLGHTYLLSGHLAQSSALVKRHWSSVDSSSRNNSGWTDSMSSVAIAASPVLLAGLDGGLRLAHFPHVQVRWCYVAGGMFLFTAIAGARRSRLSRRRAIALVTAMFGAAIGYGALYCYDGGVQVWYFASYLVPYSVMAAAVFAIPGKSWRAISTLAFAALLWRGWPVRRVATPIWPQQIGIYAAGIYLRDHPELKPVGAWNAGEESYAAGGGVINLDGLVNDDAAQFVLSNSLKQYLAERRISRVMDDSIMWESDLTRARGGYAGDVLTRCIRSENNLWQVPIPRVVGEHLVLTVLDPECLSGTGDR